MEGSASQIKQKIVCGECSNEIKQAQRLYSYHKLSKSPRYLYWKNKLAFIRATMLGKEVQIK
jgi:hypothetical protein